MTDKSFGDHTNRNTLKNPLLSTAVTGLCLEDLTHNAVLLPVSLSQEVITRPDQQIGSQSSTLGHTDHAVSSLYAGDTNSDPTLTATPVTPARPSNVPQSSTTIPDLEKPRVTQSKASSKSNDDFDVNEYFARLQGTRYVSAPLNSVLKEDANANLDATEENLEEINLNEPEKVEQQSLTSDIAQNFSQLPTMLPQVASAVFSSFSNMLQTRKSREPTPETRSVGYQEVQFERPPEPISEYIPPVAPPKEPLMMPPTDGTANYRLPTRKKYAQIPGLSSRNSAQTPLQPSSLNLPTVSQGVPQYFVPTDFGHYQISQNDPLSHNFPSMSQSAPFISQSAPPISQSKALLSQNSLPLSQNVPQYSHIAPPTEFLSQTIPQSSSEISQKVPQYFIPTTDSAPDTSNAQNQPQLPPSLNILSPPETQFFVPTAVHNPPVAVNSKAEDEQTIHNIGIENYKPPFPQSELGTAQSNVDMTKTNDNFETAKAHAPVYFVPTFSKEEASNTEEKWPLDIYSPNIPLKQEEQLNTPPRSDTNVHSYSPSPNQVLPPPPTFANLKKDSQPSSGRGILPPSVARRISSNHPVKHSPQVMSFDNIFVPAQGDPSNSDQNFAANQSAFASMSTNMPSQSPSNFTLGLDLVQESKIPPIRPPEGASPLEKQELPPRSKVVPPNIFTPSIARVETSQLMPPPPSSLFTPALTSAKEALGSPTPSFTSYSLNSNLQSPSSIQRLPPASLSSLPAFLPPPALTQKPSVFNPTASTETKEVTPITSPEELPKVPEPPKASASVSFRMAKKRPQYYAGPIEGVGAISNNVKPVIAPVNTGSYHGALFNPTELNSAAAPFDISPTTVDTTSMPFDINPPAPEAYSAPFDISHPVETMTQFDISRQETYPTAQDTTFSTVFDVSRQTTERYEPKQDSTGFGLFGSLKSKFSSLDINKIQNSVTTFFDPAYNEAKKEEISAHQSTPYEHQKYTPYEHYGQAQASNFEIIVPNVEQATEAYNQSYDLKTPYPSQYGYGQENLHYQGQQSYGYYQNTEQNVASNFGDTAQNYQAPNTNLPQNTTLTSPVSRENVKVLGSINPQEDPENISSDARIDQSSAPKPVYTQETHNKIEDKVPDLFSDISPYQIEQNKETNQYGSQNTFQTKQISNFSDLPTKKIRDETQNVKNEPEVAIQKDSQKDSLQIKAQNEIGDLDTAKEVLSNTVMRSFFDQPHIPAQNEGKFTHASPFTAHLMAKKTDVNFDMGLNFFKTPLTYPLKTQEEGQETIDLKTSEIVKEVISSVIESKIDRLDTHNVSVPQGNPLDFFGSFAEDSTAQNIFSSFVPKDSKPIQFSQKNEYIKDAPESYTANMSSAPLFGLSTMLADKTKELNDLEDEIRRMSLQELPKDIDDMLNRSTNKSFLENLDSTDENNEVKNDVSDLNICETCREVNKFDDRDEVEDFTTQLIENITSPIQLLNPVEVPLPENNTPSDERDDYNSNQCAEISHITEETIETIQVQSASELLEDEQGSNVRGYGWSEEPLSTGERNYSVPYKSKLEQDFNLPINPNAIGFFGGQRGLFEKMAANKDLEPDLKFESPLILPRQMSIPSAPPEEDDQKTEGIDVHSIEQDAKKDFPIFEEFVIEPDKDFKQSSESLKFDSFTSRVDKYKEKEGTEKTSPIFDLNATTSPSVPIASYFDTGNYAAETHYRNSLTSPNQVRVPPGFEDEFPKLLGAHESGDKQDIIPQYIPDTSTQTRPTYSPTFSTAHNLTDITTVTSSIMSGPKPEAGDRVTLPDLGSMLKKDIITDAKPSFDKTETSVGPSAEVKPDLELFLSQNKETVKSAMKESDLDFDTTFGAKKEEKFLEMPFNKQVLMPKVESQEPLPDPINFFSSNVEAPEKSEEPSENQGFNRLASYFSSPAKTDHTKSFFELSQSQNHYRHKHQAVETNTTNKTGFSLSEIQNNPVDINNIPPGQYLANLNLMKDLTSYQNAEFKPEAVMRTANYFTVEYDNEILTNEFNKGEPDFKRDLATSKIPEEFETIADDKTLKIIIKKCTHCCNLDVGHVKKFNNINHEFLTDFKVRTCTDGNKETKKEGTMDTPKEVDPRKSITVNFDGSVPEDNEGVNTTITENRIVGEYTPVRHHWFYRIDIEGKSTWRGFSVVDSRSLEDAFNSPDLDDDTLVPTDGGRFDVNIKGRLRFPVYWTEKPANVRRCSWFYKGNTEIRYVPYTEPVADKLEEEYRHGMLTGEWHRRLLLPNNEVVVMHQANVMVHFLQSGNNDAFSSPPQSTMRPRVVRRGCDESEIEEVEPSSIDHLLLMCHGVGSACDMKFRSVEEVVDDFRATSLQLIQSHYRNSFDSGIVGRVEVLPISWHATLHSGETGVDKRLARITLDSIPRLRNFTNDTVLDVLFYTSPVFCQTIINTVCSELNRIYQLFRSRNPNFEGGISLGGHSLGSVILYDLLCHQTPVPDVVGGPAEGCAKLYVSGAAGTGQPCVHYPALHFSPTALYALGSPIAIFECIRGVEALGPLFSLPTCKNFFNIFHPYDPIAYRIEPLINPDLRDIKPYLIPHHKGRKRMHLELKDTMARVGADIKQKLIESIRSTWSNMWKTHQQPTDKQLEKVVEEEMEKEPLSDEGKEELKNDDTTPDMLGALNGGRRVDYVLQEAPFEMINEYLFAMSSHVCYWESEDTMLLMLREIYDTLGVQPDSTVPQHSLTVNRVRASRTEEKLNVPVNSADHPSTSRGSM